MANDDDSAQDDTLGSAAAPSEKPTKILVPRGCKYVRLEVAIKYVIAVAAARGVFPPTFDFYAKDEDITDDGEMVGETIIDLNDGSGLALHRAKAHLATICQVLGISPRDPHNPLVDDYEGTELQNLTYRITVDEWGRLAAGYDVPFEVEPVTDGAPAIVGVAEIKHAWQDAARAIADELYDRDTAVGVRDKLAGYAKRTMEKMQQREIPGPRGRITNPATVQREALQGEKWWAKKQK